MKRYSPRLGSKADPHYNVRGMAFEVLAGRGPIRFDTSTLSDEGIRTMTPTGGWMKRNDDKLKDMGIDFFHSTTEWMSQVLTSFGGVRADKTGFTGVPGLYVAGRARSVSPGVYMGGWDTCLTSTTGCVAGDHAGRFASGVSDPNLAWEDAREAVQPIVARLGKPGIDPALSLLRGVPYETYVNYNYSVVPLFLIMGNFAFKSGISKDLYWAVHRLMGRVKGGLAMATITACGGFAAICGSSVACAVTMGVVALPEMKKFKADGDCLLFRVYANGDSANVRHSFSRIFRRSFDCSRRCRPQRAAFRGSMKC